MSVSGGKFFPDNTTYFVSGAPRAHQHGTVYIFEKEQNNPILDIKLMIVGEQFGSSFGYEILTLDVNKDGFDDLIVGAPFFFNNTNGGAVYAFYNVRDCTPADCAYDWKQIGVSESRFGFSMTSLGDINR